MALDLATTGARLRTGRPAGHTVRAVIAMIAEHLYVGGPLDGQKATGRDSRALTRSATGLALPAVVGDRAVTRMNLGQEPGPVYVRMRGSYIWLPSLAKRRREESAARQEQERQELATYADRRAGIQAQAEITRMAYLQTRSEHERGCDRCRGHAAERGEE